MRKINIYEGQNIIDIAIQEYGSVEGVKLLRDDNPELVATLEARLQPGDVLAIRDVPLDRGVRRIYERDATKVATVEEAETALLPGSLRGIGGIFLIHPNGRLLIQ